MRGISSSTTSVQHPPGWCDGSQGVPEHPTTHQLTGGEETERFSQSVDMGIVMRSWWSEANGKFGQDAWGHTSTLFEKHPGIFNDHRESSLSLRHHAHGPLAKRLMHMAHLSGNTSGVSKSSSDWLNYTGFPGDVCVAFFNVPGNKNAVTPNPLAKEESRRVYNWRRALVRIN